MISTTTARNGYLGTGSVSVYAYQFKVFLSTHLKVIQTLISTGVETTLTEGVDYTVSGVGNADGGNVTLLAGSLASAYALTLKREIPLTQLYSFQNQGGFLPRSWEDAVDYAMMVAQQLNDIMARSLHIPASEAGSESLTVLPALVNRKSMYLGFDSLGAPVALASPTGTSAVTAFMATVLLAATAAAARILLGFAGVGGTVQAANIEADAVITAKILDLNVTTGKINDLAVTTGKVADDAITNVKLAADSFPVAFGSYSLSAVVGASAMVVTMSAKGGAPTGAIPTAIDFRPATATAGAVNAVTKLATTKSLTASSGSTLGTVSGVAQYVYVYAILFSGAVELALAGSPIDVSGLVSTTAEGGAGAADSATVLYSATARTGVPARLIGRILSTQATAGTWATTPSDVQLWPFHEGLDMTEIAVNTGAGHGSTNTKVRRIETSVVSVGSSVTVAHSATLGTSFTIVKDGLYEITYGDALASAAIGISVNSNQLTTSIRTITAAHRVSPVAGGNGVDVDGGVTTTKWLKAGDVVRPHTDGSMTSTAVTVFFKIVRMR